LIHDWVVSHVTYDHESLEPGKRQPQDADTVLRRGTGVCAGYANLVVALSKAAGLDAVYITGNVRENDGSLAGSSHAWNAVKVDGKWALMDTTWDVVSDADGSGTPRYRSDYLFTPPEVFRYDHLPERESWQLHSAPISKGDFIRQPALSPGFFASGLVLVDPKRSSVDARDAVSVTLDNPKRRSVAARLGGERCTVTGTSRVSVSCQVPRSGQHRLDVFENKVAVGSHRQVASWIVNGI
jgi:transglutaminase/protease-like cytokinesis protein 3